MALFTKTLPSSWYCSAPLYQLERRAVFLKVRPVTSRKVRKIGAKNQQAWYLLGPVTRFEAVGEKVEYEVAQVHLTAMRMSDASQDIKVFKGDTVRPTALHTPKKATQDFQDGELKSYVTDTGLLFSTISDEAPSFDEFFPDLKPLLGTVDFTKLPYRRSIQYEGNFNWKTMYDHLFS
jgi:hypothetical protein